MPSESTAFEESVHRPLLDPRLRIEQALELAVGDAAFRSVEIGTTPRAILRDRSADDRSGDPI
jgi:hypothetical protein